MASFGDSKTKSGWHRSLDFPGYVWIVKGTAPPEQFDPGMPLTYQNVKIVRIAAGTSFNLPAMLGNANPTAAPGIVVYTLTVEDGKVRVVTPVLADETKIYGLGIDPKTGGGT